jgi:hypothetical protein
MKGQAGYAGVSYPGQEILSSCNGTTTINALTSAILCSYAFTADKFSDRDFIEVELVVARNWYYFNADIIINGVGVLRYPNSHNAFTSQRAIMCRFENNVRASTTAETITDLGYNWMASSGAISLSMTNIDPVVNVQVPYVVKISRVWS